MNAMSDIAEDSFRSLNSLHMYVLSSETRTIPTCSPQIYRPVRLSAFELTATEDSAIPQTLVELPHNLNSPQLVVGFVSRPQRQDPA